MLAGTIFAVLSPEGWLDPEAHDSDLRGSRGVAAAGVLLIFMGVANFRNTVRVCACAAAHAVLMVHEGCRRAPPKDGPRFMHEPC